jgi:hypothetical protein
MMATSAVTLVRYRNVSGRDLEWIGPFGRKITLAPGRGGDFANCPAIAELGRQGLLVQPLDPRLARIELPNSTERPVPA